MTKFSENFDPRELLLKWMLTGRSISATAPARNQEDCVMWEAMSGRLTEDLLRPM